MRVMLLLLGTLVAMAACFTFGGYQLGQATLYRRLRRGPRPALEGATDTELVTEILARQLRAALLTGDAAQVAHIRQLAEQMPPLQERIASLLAEMPQLTTHGGPRGQA